MSNEIILWAIGISGNSSAIRSFLKVTGIPFKEENAWGKTRTEEYIAKFPTNLAPAIEHGSVCLSENAAIMRYLCRAFPDKAGKYYMADKWNEIDMLLDYISTGILELLPKAAYPRLGFPAYPGDVAAMECTREHTEEACNAAGTAILQLLTDKYAGIFLANTKYLLSDQPTIADFRFAPMINFIKVACKIPPRIQTYYDDMAKLPGFAEACAPAAEFASKNWR